MSGWAIFGIIAAAITIGFILSYIIIGIFFYGISVNRRALVGDIVSRHLEKHMKEYLIDRKWWDTQKIEELEIKVGKEKLAGYLIRSKEASKKVAIVVHGYYVTHKDVNVQAKIFLERGFNVFAPDLRAHGKSTGKTISMGAFDKGDIVLWTKKIIELFGKGCEIVMFGISMGGATVCLSSGEKLPSNVKCIVSDCAYDNLYDQFSYVLKKKMRLPGFPILRISSKFIKGIGKYNVKDVNPRKAVKKAKVPILFIHGSADEFVPSYMAERLYNSSNKKKCEIYIVEGALHAQSYVKNPERYEQVMMNFVDKYIKR